MDERRRFKVIPILALVISIFAAAFSGLSLYWQKYMWDHATAMLTVEPIGESDNLTSVLVRNSGRASVTIGGFKLQSQTGEAKLVLNPASGPAAIPTWGGNLVATQTAILPPGGLEFFVLAFDPVAYECVNKTIALDSLRTFLITGDKDVPFDLSDDAKKRIAERVSALLAP